MKKIALLGLASMTLMGCGIADKLHMGPRVEGSGKVVTEDRKLEKFDTVSIAGSTSVVWKKGDTYAAQVTVDDNIQKHLKTEVNGSELKIYLEGNISTSSDVKVQITCPNVKSLSIAGSGSFSGDSLDAESFEATISGSGEIDLDGTVETLNLTVTGSGEANLSGLKSKQVSAQITGSGNAQVNATETLDANITGSGTVSYIGDPKVTKNITGSGEITAAK